MMIEATDIRKSYGKLEVLKGIDLTINKAEVMAIVGPSGAGKSTLLHLLSSLDKPDSGRVLFNGKDIYRMSRNDLALFRNRNIGFVFQFHQLLPEFTLR